MKKIFGCILVLCGFSFLFSQEIETVETSNLEMPNEKTSAEEVKIDETNQVNKEYLDEKIIELNTKVDEINTKIDETNQVNKEYLESKVDEVNAKIDESKDFLNTKIDEIKSKQKLEGIHKEISDITFQIKCARNEIVQLNNRLAKKEHDKYNRNLYIELGYAPKVFAFKLPIMLDNGKIIDSNCHLNGFSFGVFNYEKPISIGVEARLNYFLKDTYIYLKKNNTTPKSDMEYYDFEFDGVFGLGYNNNYAGIYVYGVIGTNAKYSRSEIDDNFVSKKTEISVPFGFRIKGFVGTRRVKLTASYQRTFVDLLDFVYLEEDYETSTLDSLKWNVQNNFTIALMIGF